MGTNERILAAIASDLIVRGDDVGERHSVDWSAEHAHRPELVLQPRTTDDVSNILKACRSAGQALVVQGGMTGISGGATPQAGEWALSLERMNKVIELDQAAMTITVAAGTPLDTIQMAAEEAGLRFPLDLGSRGSCLAGGLVATNAGGNQVIRFGMARALVLGLVAVLADGTVIPADNKLLKNNSGFDVKQLFIGSEGTLGVVTEVTFRLIPQKISRQTALCAVSSFDDVVSLLQKMGRELDSLSSYEVMWADYYREALRATKSTNPLEGNYPFYVLLEAEGAHQASAAEVFEAALGSAMEEGLIPDAAVAQSRAQEQAFWKIRDGIAELIPEFDPAVNIDVGIPISMMESFASEVRNELIKTYPNCRVLVFGHIGDGNLHLIATTGRSEDKQAIYELIYRKTGEVKGAITAEHGIGALKKQWLSYSRSDAEIELMRSLKALLDPSNILNPGRVI